MDLFLQISGFTIGILYLWWEYHADARLWIASVIMPTISLWLYFRKGLYADFAINIYYLIIAVYGYLTWTRGKKHTRQEDKGKKSSAVEIRHASIAVVTGSAVATAILWVLIWWILSRFTNSTVPITDSFTTALSIVAMWMLARKYIEQWIAWIVVDAVCVGLYIYKGIPFYAVLYGIYTIIAVLGYKKWEKLLSLRHG